MHDMTRLDQHLAHLTKLMSLYPQAWRAYVWERAKELAKRPELEQLPNLLASSIRASTTPLKDIPISGEASS